MCRQPGPCTRRPVHNHPTPQGASGYSLRLSGFSLPGCCLPAGHQSAGEPTAALAPSLSPRFPQEAQPQAHTAGWYQEVKGSVLTALCILTPLPLVGCFSWTARLGSFSKDRLELCLKIPAWMLGGICPPRTAKLARLREHGPKTAGQVVGLITASSTRPDVGEHNGGDPEAPPNNLDL